MEVGHTGRHTVRSSIGHPERLLVGYLMANSEGHLCHIPQEVPKSWVTAKVSAPIEGALLLA